jgi:chromosome partitioning protein
MLIAVLHLKGGSGKSTLAINLAAVACLEGLRVLIVDLDTQGTALDWGDARSEASPLMAISVVKLDKPTALERTRLEPVVRDYDLVLLDAPARDSKITEAAAQAADLVLLPVQPGAADFWALPDTLAALEAADATRELRGLGPVPRCHVISRAVAGSRLERSAQSHLLSTIGDYAGVIHQRLVFSEATARGESVVTMKPAAPEAANEIRQLWRTIMLRAPKRPRLQVANDRKRAR